MKICIFTATYPDNNYEGIFVKNHSELLAKDNNVAVLFSKGIKPALSSNHRNKNNQVTFTKVGDIELYTNCSSRIYASYFVSFRLHRKTAISSTCNLQKEPISAPVFTTAIPESASGSFPKTRTTPLTRHSGNADCVGRLPTDGR